MKRIITINGLLFASLFIAAVPGETFSVNLPTHKIKSPSNPLPGISPSNPGRSRKTKPVAVTYGGDSHVGFIDPSGGSQVTMEVGHYQASSKRGRPTSTTGPQVVMTLETPAGGCVSSSSALVSLEVPTGSIDPSEFGSHLDDGTIAALENVLQTDQGKEMLSMLEGMGVVGSIPESGVNTWEHDTVVSSSGGVGSSALVTSESPSSTTMMSPTSNTTVSQHPKPAQITLKGVAVGGRSSTGAGRPPGKVQSVSTPPGRKVSESDSNIRRSQRQQDRIERQEAERIREENQQMLQREKEEMQAAIQQQQVAATTGHDTVPPVVANQPVTVGIVSSTQVATPVHSAPSTPISTPTAVDKIDSTSERGSGRRPVRNRKLPAHLADPNYLSLEDATHAVKEATRRSSTQQDMAPDEILSAPGTPGSVHSGKAVGTPVVEQAASIKSDDQQGHSSQDDATEEEDEYTDDDPNKLWCICRTPHNNRFMICCDRCEDWFHGKCVNVTKAQGKAMELKNITWNCPTCKKILAEEKKQANLQTKQTQRPVQPAKSKTQASPEVPNRGRKSSGASATTVPEVQPLKVASPPKSPAVVNKKLSSSEMAQKIDAEAAAQVAISAEPPRKASTGLRQSAGRAGRRKSELARAMSPDMTQVQPPSPSCRNCKKPTRKGSTYCSDVCAQKLSEHVPTQKTPMKVSPKQEKANTESAAAPSAVPEVNPPLSTPSTPLPEQSPTQKSPGNAQSKLKVRMRILCNSDVIDMFY